MSTIPKLLALDNTASTGSGSYVDDVFSSYTYKGTGAPLTITDNINRTVLGALDIFKSRSASTDWAWYDTTRGVQKDLVSNNTAAETTQAQGVTAVSATGITVGTLAKLNTSGESYVKYAFQEAQNFFAKRSLSHTNGVANTVDLSLLGTVGMVAVKRTDSTSDWLVWHRSQTAGKLTYLNKTTVETTDSSISVAGTVLTLAAALATGTYIVYAWANDSTTGGLIQCGSYVASGSQINITLGFEPQFIMRKSLNAGDNWRITDINRGWPGGTGDEGTIAVIDANDSSAENTPSAIMKVTPTGFTNVTETGTFIYLAIRRPNKPPTSGTQVYNAVTRTGTGVAATITGVGFPPDLVMSKWRNAAGDVGFYDRLRGSGKVLSSSSSSAEKNDVAAPNYAIAAFEQDGLSLGQDSLYAYLNTNGSSCVSYFMRRSPGFLDEVCDTGTGSAHAITHNLTVAPEMIWRKSRSAAAQWEVWHSAMANTEKLVLNSAAAKVTDATTWNGITPDASTFTVGAGANINTNAVAYVTYLFATLPGISKVFTYTGNGTSQTINCGFAAGARFLLIKRADSSGDWFVWDTTRGIVVGNDLHLSLNITVAEVATDDTIDPAASGFIVKQNTATNVNVIAATYVGFAIS